VSTVSDPALLLVDDRAENLLALEATLEPLGHRMVRAESGEEALRQLLVDEVAVIVLDVQMPGLDGFETAAAIKERERTRDIPIIFLTALSREEEHRLRGYETGAVDYVFKPVDPDLLRAKVAVFVELHLAHRRLREQAEELARSNHDLEQFSWIASHDLQEPLRIVSGYLELIADALGGGSPEQVTQWIGRAQETAGRMSTLVSDLLDYSRAGAGERTPEVVDLDEAATLALRDVDTSEADVTVEPLGRAWAVPSEVRRVLQNLVANAVKYRGAAPPEVRIAASRREDVVELCVRDNGIGVAEADLRRVFGMFERVDGMPYPGSGLGLAVCRRLVERAGGRIWMERNAGPGVTVHLTLPVPP
jgi:signal transduction histidine kinase